MNCKIVRKKETPNIWEFFENEKLLITIDETKETSTGKGLLTIHKTFNRRPEEIDIAFEVIKPYVGNTITENELYDIVKETINFPVPLVTTKCAVSKLRIFPFTTRS